jgi:membrane-associated protease RseP (regulator of RpoE activity)
MTNGKVILAMALIVACSLVASVIVGAFAGGIAGYLVARWEGRNPTPLPEEWGEMPFPLPPLRWEEPVEGALVIEVEPESPAEEAGIKVGDTITAVDGQKIKEDHPFRDLILEHEPGEEITLTLRRWGDSREVQMTLGETTDEEGETIPYLGVHYRSIKGEFFQPQRFDLSRLPLPRFYPLFGRLLRRVRLCLPGL